MLQRNERLLGLYNYRQMFLGHFTPSRCFQLLQIILATTLVKMTHASPYPINNVEQQINCWSMGNHRGTGEGGVNFPRICLTVTEMQRCPKNIEEDCRLNFFGYSNYSHTRNCWYMKLYFENSNNWKTGNYLNKVYYNGI